MESTVINKNETKIVAQSTFKEKINKVTNQKSFNDSKNFDGKHKFNKNSPRKPRNFRRQRDQSPYEEKVVAINRVSKTTKGGRKISFTALVVIGDRRGRVGWALSKAAEVPTAIKKAIKKAQKNVVRISLVKGDTIAHEIIGKAGSGRVFLKNAKVGTGIIAGSATRSVLELAGIRNICSKIQGSKTPINVVRATFNGLKNLQVASIVAKLRDKEIKEL